MQANRSRRALPTAGRKEPHLGDNAAQQADIPEAGCGFLQLGENRWPGPGNPGR